MTETEKDKLIAQMRDALTTAKAMIQHHAKGATGCYADVMALEEIEEALTAAQPQPAGAS